MASLLLPLFYYSSYAQISFKTAVETKDCCAGACGLSNYSLNFPTSGDPGFEFNITGTLPHDSQEWYLKLEGSIEGYAIFNASTSACGKVTQSIGSVLLGHIEINFPTCPIPSGPVNIHGRVVLNIPVTVVRVEISAVV